MKHLIGVLVMAYGTPRRTEEIEPYYTHIRRGRPPEPHQLAELVSRYEAIGGVSPLTDNTEKQARGLEALLNQRQPDTRFRVYTGMKHAHPFIDETVNQMRDDCIERAVGIVLAPHYSAMSVGTYIAGAEEAAKQDGPAFSFVQSWHLEPAFLASTAARVRDALDQFPLGERQDVPVVFTAHSLPKRIEELGDPYAGQIRESAAAVTGLLGHSKWSCGWQSAGRTPEPWLGPDILELIRAIHDHGTNKLVVCPIGFVSDHLEVLYDLDIEAQALVKQLGMTLVRTKSPNDEPLFLQALADAVLRQI
ncbi:MAG: ferrochelatase [Bacilli bacterium]|nr:ferrochelatase [Bacilli bacterium]